MSSLRALIVCGLSALVAACGEEPASPNPQGFERRPHEGPKLMANGEPQWVTYDYILILFEGSHKDKESFRPKEAAEKLARRIFERLEEGEDWAALKHQYTEDRSKNDVPLGPHTLLNYGLTTKRPYVYPREKWAPLIAGRVFRMDVGEMRFVPYRENNPGLFGYQIVKRLQ